MAKSQIDGSEVVTAPAEPGEFTLTLQEFCMRISITDKRVELIGGFEHSERSAGNANDTETAYRSRFISFANRPA